jgi:hypothetical protein
MSYSIASGIISGMSTEQADKIRENRLRRMASRQRIEMHKSRRRDPLAWDYGRYWLLPTLGEVIGAAGSPGTVGDPPGLTLDEVEELLTHKGEADGR